jgi:hypothetical protein
MSFETDSHDVSACGRLIWIGVTERAWTSPHPALRDRMAVAGGPDQAVDADLVSQIARFIL